jgi:glycosyltransferase involved in cell wall biosynthesis
MRLAVFTNQFPTKVSTFFSRDMRVLLDSGFDIDVFPFYPCDPNLWRYVPAILDEKVFPRNKFHHVSIARSLYCPMRPPFRKLSMFFGDAAAISASALKFGIIPLSKSMYVFPKAWAWALRNHTEYDHVLAYWGNYSATCAYIFHRLLDRAIPYSMFLHAGVDLYADQVYLREKLLYSDNIIVVCDFNRQFIQELYSDIYPLISSKIHLYHLGLDLATFPYQPNHRPAGKILAVGSLEKYKGYEYLLHAAFELSRRGVYFELEFVGDGKEAEVLKTLAKQLLISDRVRFTGWLRPADVKAEMEGATVFVHPSNGLGDAVPTVIKEAMALGVPVVASNTAGIPELLDGGKCGILVPPRNVIALADAVQKLLTNEQLRLCYADAARKYAETTFDLWQNGHQLANLLKSSRRMFGLSSKKTCTGASELSSS